MVRITERLASVPGAVKSRSKNCSNCGHSVNSSGAIRVRPAVNSTTLPSQLKVTPLRTAMSISSVIELISFWLICIRSSVSVAVVGFDGERREGLGVLPGEQDRRRQAKQGSGRFHAVAEISTRPCSAS